VVIAVDTPVGSERLDDVEAVAAVRIPDRRSPRTSLVLDLDQHGIAGDNRAVNNEVPARQARLAVADGVGGQLGCAEKSVVGTGTAVEQTGDGSPDGADLLGSARVAGADRAQCRSSEDSRTSVERQGSDGAFDRGRRSG